MYDNFGEIHNGRNGHNGHSGGANGQTAQQITIKDISTDSPSPTLPPDIPPRAQVQGVNGDTGPKYGGFKPTNTDTDKDTAALVEEDDDL